MGRWAANGTYVDNTVDVADIQSSGLVPTEEQAKYTPQEKTLNAVTVTAGGATNFTSNIVTMDGFNTLGVGLTADISHSWNLNVYSSPDGTTLISPAFITQSSTSTTKGGSGTCPLNFAVIQIVNNDAATRTYNAWSRKLNL
ncbi:hypothetical protein AVT25_gp08 [Bacillus phage Pavlov]|uniref:hypothetical protein n=1 Tax=Bacillus phage Pavlov TaxID=1675598 RepID=UPI00065F618D|nr:hypothetical protein AVT25_gp08 [Bacillus phage Pavlov]AKQ07429.1 hypothetical protein CPT_Pavlov8 [Bacillus phage Pavlov]